MNENADVALKIFRAVEERNGEVLLSLCHPDVEFHWPPSLPFGGSQHGLEELAHHGHDWAETWNAFQTSGERKMDPRVIADCDDEVVVLWWQRAVAPDGTRLDAQVVSLYEIHDQKLSRAQMFYFDAIEVNKFLTDANC
jgi:ketosteroid isomerase-like protein